MTKEEVPKPSIMDDYVLVASGQRGRRGQRSPYHLALLAGHPVALTNAAFVLLLELVRARLKTHTGYLCLPLGSDPEAFRLGIHRLRRQIDMCVGEGNKWIETGVGCEYRLVIPPDKIAVDAGFSELPRALVSDDLRDYLVEHCPEVALQRLR